VSETATGEILENDGSDKTHQRVFENVTETSNDQSKSHDVGPNDSSLKVKVGRGQRRGAHDSKGSQDAKRTDDSSIAIVDTKSLDNTQDNRRAGSSKKKKSESLQDKGRRRRIDKTASPFNTDSLEDVTSMATAIQEQDCKNDKVIQHEYDNLARKKAPRSRRLSKASSGSPIDGLRKTHSNLELQYEKGHEDRNILISKSDVITSNFQTVPDITSNGSHTRSLLPTKFSHNEDDVTISQGSFDFLTESAKDATIDDVVKPDFGLFVPEVHQNLSGSVHFDDSISFSKRFCYATDASNDGEETLAKFDDGFIALASVNSGEKHENFFDGDFEGFTSIPEDVFSPNNIRNPPRTGGTEQKSAYTGFDGDNFGAFAQSFEPESHFKVLPIHDPIINTFCNNATSAGLSTLSPRKIRCHDKKSGLFLDFCTKQNCE
jgi:hypothetical protein